MRKIEEEEALNIPLSSCVTLYVNERNNIMAESVYKVISLVGTSAESWDKAAAAAIAEASRTLRDLRVARIVEQDIHIEGQTLTYRVKLELSFKYEGGA
jgi:flavin-binding protein dodecin